MRAISVPICGPDQIGMTFNRENHPEHYMTYLDYNSTTPVDSRVVEIMVPIFNERFGNPSSVGHGTGRAA